MLGGRVWEPHNDLFGFAPFIAGSAAVHSWPWYWQLLLQRADRHLYRGVHLEQGTVPAQANAGPARRHSFSDLWPVGHSDDRAVYPRHGRSYHRQLAIATSPSSALITRAATAFWLRAACWPSWFPDRGRGRRSDAQHARDAWSLLSLGATKWEQHTLYRTAPGPAGHHCRRRARLWRTFGETLAVLMVAGNVAQIPPRSSTTPIAASAVCQQLRRNDVRSPLRVGLMSAALLLIAVFNISARRHRPPWKGTLACSTLYCARHSSHAAGVGRCVLSLVHASQRGKRGVILCVILA